MSLNVCVGSEMKLLVYGEKEKCKLSDCYKSTYSFFSWMMWL